MRFDDANQDIVAVLFPGAGLLQHLIGLADAGSRADENLEPAGSALFSPGGLEQGLRRGSLVRIAPVIHHQKTDALPCKASRAGLARRRAIERQIERQDVHPRLAQKA